MFGLITVAAISLGAVTVGAGPENIYAFTMKDIEGKEVPLEKFKDKVLVVVNVASKCGMTPQYEGLQKLYTDYKDKGLVVLGFPANNFGGQEPGTDQEIKTFCTTNYGVTFPMFSKISVKGDDTNPLYQWLIANAPYQDDIEWNFAKFVIGKNGKVAARFPHKVKPNAPEFLKAVMAELDK